MDKGSFAEDDEKEHKRASPADFDEFIPWACSQLQLEITPIIIRLEQSDYTPSTGDRAKAQKSFKAKDETIDDSDAAGSKNDSKKSILAQKGNTVCIYTVYDGSDSLVQLKFLKNVFIPRLLLKIISLVVPFHPRLTSIYINSGLKQDGLYELYKVVANSKVTEIILDNTLLPEANYYLLLDNNSSLKYLSLARCKLNDTVVKTLAVKLVYPYSASKTLSVLNLSSNRITDEGAKYLGEALKTNRQLSYLNLADNMITDVGADSIFDSLIEFPLTANEIKEKKARHLAYLKEKNDLINATAKEIRSCEFDKRSLKRKLIKASSAQTPTSRKTKVPEKESSLRSVQGGSPDRVWLEKAEAAAEAQLGLFNDPFKSDNVIIKDEVVYCLGNNSLCYLSLAYNNLTYFSLKKLYDVLNFQDILNRKPKGLINVCIEGNNLPDTCMELIEIDYIIESNLATARKLSAMKKKAGGKTK